jgi:2-oxoglutarate ferredoxin oxidoreductase subunit beta
MAEIIAGLPGAAYVVRRSLHNPKEIIRARKAVRRAFEVQLAGQGFALVELLSSCPTNWGISPVDSLKWIEEHMLPYYPLGDYKVADGK